MAETYKINATDVTTYLTHLQVIDGSIGIPPMRQDDYVVPGRTGAVAATPWWRSEERRVGKECRL